MSIEKFENEIIKDFGLFTSDKEGYENKVKDVSNKLGVSLRYDYLPDYVSGNYKSEYDKYIIVSLNPGFNSDGLNDAEENVKKQSIDTYMNFMLNFFGIVPNIKYKSKKTNKIEKWNSPYYNRLYKYFYMLDTGNKVNNAQTNDDMYKFYHQHLINVDLIPYHSLSFSSALNPNDYLKGRMLDIMDFIKDLKNVKCVIFNAKQDSIMPLINGSFQLNDIQTLFVKRKPSKKGTNYKDFQIKIFTINGIKCFSHNFITNTRGIYDEDIENVASEIRKNI